MGIKYLICDSLFDKQPLLNLVKENISKLTAQQKEETAVKEFLNWIPAKNELIVLTVYAPDDIDLPFSFDTLFYGNDPHNPIKVDVSIIMSIFNGLFPADTISKGHKHICMLRFNSNNADTILRLPKFRQGQSWNNASGNIYLCNARDYDILSKVFNLDK